MLFENNFKKCIFNKWLILRSAKELSDVVEQNQYWLGQPHIGFARGYQNVFYMIGDHFLDPVQSPKGYFRCLIFSFRSCVSQSHILAKMDDILRPSHSTPPTRPRPKIISIQEGSSARIYPSYHLLVEMYGSFRIWEIVLYSFENLYNDFLLL